MKNGNFNQSFKQEILYIIPLLVCYASIALWVLSFTLSISFEFRIILFCVVLMLWRFLAPAKFYKLPKWMGVFAASILVAIIIWKILGENNNPQNGLLFKSPGGSQINPINRILKEEDVVYLSTRTLGLLYGLTSKESQGLLPSVEVNYEKMRNSEGDYTSPLLASVIGLNYGNSNDSLLFCGGECKEKKNEISSAVIFLHGVGGNWSLICWTLAKPLNDLGMLVVCPSLGPLGMWGSDSGEKIVVRTIEDLKKRGIKRIYLSGISAGAVGVGELAHKIEGELDGVILLFGAHPNIDLTAIPTLLIYGKDDERFPAKLIEWVIKQREKKKSGLHSYGIDGGHFEIVKNDKKIIELIKNWLEGH